MYNYCLLPIAFPRGGKSYYRARLLEAHPEIKVVCPDDIRAELGGSRENFSNENRVWMLVDERVEDLFNKGYTIFLDATNVRQRNRRPFVEAYPCVALVFDTSVEICKARAIKVGPPGIEKIIDRMASYYTPPYMGEGWLRIYYPGDTVAPYGEDGLKFTFDYKDQPEENL
jgi:predicted kinase